MMIVSVLLASCARQKELKVQPFSVLSGGESMNEATDAVIKAGETFDSFEMAEAAQIVSVADNGVVFDDYSAAKQNTKILTRLIRKAKKNTCLTFDGGALYLAASNRGCLPVIGKTGLYLKGNGTRLINVSYTAVDGKTADRYNDSLFVPVINSHNITLDGFEFDYDNRTDAEGTIIRQTDEKTYVRLFDEYAFGAKKWVIGGEYVFAASIFDGDTVAPDEYYYPGDADSFVEMTGDGEIAVPRCPGNVGQNIALRFSSGTYTCVLMPVQNTSGLTVRNVTVRSCPSAIVYAPCGNADFCFENFGVKPYDGSEALYASNVDCIHIKGLRGRLVLRNCDFVGIGDDALNVHSRAAAVSSVSDNTVTLLDGFEEHKLDGAWATVGDVCAFYDKDCRLLGNAPVTAIRGNKYSFEVLPDGVGTDTFVQNTAWAPLTLIENCHVERSRARGFLLQTKNAVVKDCRFDNIRLSAVLISPDFRYWYESGFCDNVLVENCAFDKCGSGLGDRGFGVITASACHDKPVPIAGKPHGNITAANNTFTDCAEPWKMYGVTNFTEDNNTVN